MEYVLKKTIKIDVVLVFLLLTLNKFHTFFLVFLLLTLSRKMISGYVSSSKILLKYCPLAWKNWSQKPWNQEYYTKLWLESVLISIHGFEQNKIFQFFGSRFFFVFRGPFVFFIPGDIQAFQILVQKIFFTHAALDLHAQSKDYFQIIQLHISKVINKDGRMTSINVVQFPFLLIFSFFQAHFNVCVGDANVDFASCIPNMFWWLSPPSSNRLRHNATLYKSSFI